MLMGHLQERNHLINTVVFPMKDEAGDTTVTPDEEM